ncbi:MAG: AAA family ATPase [Desulfuromonadaceae bacterium]|nr:AAA family ATPase [Desulfuromonadaceae bacterium]MDD2855217.1 AAA family ATPase [Desulfuromonadaceae bacterium]
MYTKYYGFNEKPFTLTPNPRFIYLSKNHKEAFAHLLYGINNHYGFIELIGEVGTGKTTVLRTLLSQLQEENYRTALIVNPCLTGVELLRSICHEFGLDSTSQYSNELLIEINKFLLQETAEGRTVVLVIDESQNLQPAVLEQIRLISNLETDNDKLIQIILAGQPELSELLSRPELRQLNQRIAVRYRLKSMTMLETRAYIRHRMIIAGETGGVSFSMFAIRWLYLYTRGVPRMINILCDRALLIGYGDERRRITAGVVTKAIRELLNVPQGKKFSFAYLSLILIILTAVILAFTGEISKLLPNILSKQKTTQAAVPPAVPEKITAAAIKHSENGSPRSGAGDIDPVLLKLQQKVLSFNQNDIHISAFNAIADKWGVRKIKSMGGMLTIPDLYSRIAAKRNLRVTEFRGTLDDVAQFDIPFLVKTKFSGTLDNYFLAVTAIEKETVTLSSNLLENNKLQKSSLNSIITGTFYLVWQNIGQIPYTLKQGEKLYEIRALQTLLKNAGLYKGEIDGEYNVITIKAVTDFQKSVGFEVDEKVGELTVAALSKYYTNSKVPSISALEHSI